MVDMQDKLALNASSLERLADYAARHHAAGTRIQGIAVNRSCDCGDMLLAVSQLTLFIVVQGESEIVVGDDLYCCGTGASFIADPNRPFVNRIRRASSHVPYLAICIMLDAAAILDLLNVLTSTCPCEDGAPSHMLQVPDRPILDTVERLLQVTDSPDDIPVLAPLIQRELMWRLLKSPLGGVISQLVQPNRHVAQIAVVTEWMRKHFTEPLNVAALAQRANMSVPSFHRHFKAVTRLSPLQYLKQLRLQDARCRVLRTQNIGAAAFDVGYESLSQFNRDYRKMYGRPPSQDLVRMSLTTSGR